MTTTAAFGWGSSHLNTTPGGEVDLDPAERLAVQQTLARYAFALDHGDLVTLAGVLTEDATWTVNIAGEVEQGPFVGRAAILDLVRDATEAQTDQRRHNLINMVFRRADVDTAVVWAYLMLTSNAGGSATGFYTPLPAGRRRRCRRRCPAAAAHPVTAALRACPRGCRGGPLQSSGQIRLRPARCLAGRALTAGHAGHVRVGGHMDRSRGARAVGRKWATGARAPRWPPTAPSSSPPTSRSTSAIPAAPWQRGSNENTYWYSLGGPGCFDGRGSAGPPGDSENTCRKAFR